MLMFITCYCPLSCLSGVHIVNVVFDLRGWMFLFFLNVYTLCHISHHVLLTNS